MPTIKSTLYCNKLQSVSMASLLEHNYCNSMKISMHSVGARTHTHTHGLYFTVFIESDFVFTAGCVEAPVGRLETSSTDIVHLNVITKYHILI